MRWKYETKIERRARLGSWHVWFTWYPVKYQGNAYWLEKVLRRVYIYDITKSMSEENPPHGTLQYKPITVENLLEDK